MEEGIDTWIYKTSKETGVGISGREGSKIALARALHKKSPFIILDEPTAALDPIAEAEIYSRFQKLWEAELQFIYRTVYRPAGSVTI